MPAPRRWQIRALAEIAFVLDRVLDVPRQELVATLIRFLLRENIQLARLDKPLALRALQLCAGSKRVSFADALIWAEAVQEEATIVYTFNRGFPNEDIELRSKLEDC